MPLPLEDYAMIGDCETAALLGTNEHGRWLITPQAADAKVTRWRQQTPQRCSQMK